MEKLSYERDRERDDLDEIINRLAIRVNRISSPSHLEFIFLFCDWWPSRCPICFIHNRKRIPAPFPKCVLLGLRPKSTGPPEGTGNGYLQTNLKASDFLLHPRREILYKPACHFMFPPLFPTPHMPRRRYRRQTRKVYSIV